MNKETNLLFSFLSSKNIKIPFTDEITPTRNSRKASIDFEKGGK